MALFFFCVFLFFFFSFFFVLLCWDAFCVLSSLFFFVKTVQVSQVAVFPQAAEQDANQFHLWRPLPPMWQVNKPTQLNCLTCTGSSQFVLCFFCRMMTTATSALCVTGSSDDVLC